jgi:hypothetical protein
LAEGIPIYLNTGDACCEHDQYFVIEKQFFPGLGTEEAERVQRA